MCRGGRKSDFGGYYMHIEPGRSFIGGGIYMPPSPVLKAIRKEIYEHTDEFKDIIHNGSFKKHFKLSEDDKLKSAPQGFPKDFPDIDLLKYKSYVVGKMKTDEEMKNKNILKEIKEVFKSLYPLSRFLNEAIENA